ncbi:hypothetical protein [Brevundimonas sp.]|uniref:hypothetical protein n=1 Tax=Brevundimonas sp. TaxID=1871086 RepID=UPI003AFFC1E3
MAIPDYNGRKVWLSMPEGLRPGDILLTRNVYGTAKKNLDATLIHGATGGEFDHALICTSPPTFAEAISIGVTTLSVYRCFAHELEHVRVLRLPDVETAARAAGLAQMQVGRSYCKRRAVASVFPDAVINRIRSKGIFCSSLVAQVFQQAGAKAFEGVQVARTTPATLANLAGLEDVTWQVFRHDLAPANIEELSALDGERVYTPSYRQTLFTLAYADALLPLADEFAAAFSEADLTPPVTFYELIDFLVSAHRKMSDLPRPLQPAFLTALIDLDNQTDRLMADGALDGVFKEMRALEGASLTNMIAKSYDAKPDIDTAALKGLLSNRRSEMPKRLEAALSFAPDRDVLKSVDRWCGWQDAVNGDFKASVTLLQEVVQRVEGRSAADR